MATYEERLAKAHDAVMEAHRAIDRALTTVQSIAATTSDERLRRSAGAAAAELERVSLHRAVEHLADAEGDALRMTRW